MTTFYWTHINAINLANGLAGNSATWASLAKNADFLNATYVPPAGACVIGPGDTTGAKTDATGSTVDLFRFTVPKDTALRAIEFSFYARVDGGSATRFYVNMDSGGGTGTQTVTATSATWHTVTLTPTSAVHPRTGTVTVRLGSGTSLAQVFGYWVRVAEADPTAGIDAAGAVAMRSGMYAADAPLSTERVMRVQRTPIAVVKDRPAALVTLVDGYNSTDSRAAYGTTETTFQPVARFMLPHSDPQKRTYRISSLWRTSATAMEAKINVGGYFFEFTPSSGVWQQTTVDLGLNEGLWGSAVCRVSSGAGRAMLKNLHITREP